MDHTSRAKIAEALELLEEAAQQKKDELRTAMSDKYTHLRSMVVDTEGSILRSLTDAKDHAIHAALHAKDVGVDKAREIAHDVDKSVRHNPWPYIAGTAAVGLLVGFLLGRNRK